MPVKLPPPDAGTDAQPGPKSFAAVAAEDDAIGEEADAIGDEAFDEAGEAAVDDADEPHAAVARPRPAARVVAARRRYFMVISLIGMLRLISPADFTGRFLGSVSWVGFLGRFLGSVSSVGFTGRLLD
jgi:hypothetical protein